MKIKNILLFALIISCLSCQKIIDSANSLSKENLKLEDLKHVRVGNEYSIAIPSYMKEMKTLHDEASFEYANIFKETYSIVLDESKQEFINTFKNIKMYNDSISPLENYTKIQLQNLQENITELTVKKIDFKIKNLPSNTYEFYGKVDDLNIAYLVGFIEGKEKMYLIMSWTLKERFKKYLDTFKLMHSSFKLI